MSETKAIHYFERALAVMASFITIVQLGIALPSLVGIQIPIITTKLLDLILPTRIVIVVILEFAFAHIFGYFFGWASKSGHTPFTVFAYVSVSMISAWVSLFNVQVILWGKTIRGSSNLLGLFPVICIAAIIDVYFAQSHIQNNEGNLLIFAMASQAAAFLILYASLFF